MQSLNIGTSASGFLHLHFNLSRGEVANPFVPGTKKGIITWSVNSGATLSLVCSVEVKIYITDVLKEIAWRRTQSQEQEGFWDCSRVMSVLSPLLCSLWSTFQA